MNPTSPLAERLKAQIEEERKLLEHQTQEILMQHGESLKKLSEDALNTTKDALKKESVLLSKSLKSVRDDSEKAWKIVLNRLWWASLFPILLTILLCAACVMVIWWEMPGWLTDIQTKEMVFSDGKSYQIITSPGWTVCQSSPGVWIPYKPRKE